MACVWPPQTSIKRYCRLGSARRRISAMVLRITAESRTSSTNFMAVFLSGTTVAGETFTTVACDFFQRGIRFPEHGQHRHLVERILLADFAESEAHVNQYPV